MNKFLFELEFKGLPIKFHLSSIFLLFSGIYYLNNIPLGLAAILSSILIVFLHEMGHAYFVKKFKYRLDAIVVQFMGGYCEHEQAYYAKDEFWISIGGLIFQIFLFILSILIYIILIFFKMNNISILKLIFLDRFIFFNLLIILINSLPLQGFDGYSIKYAYKAMQNNRGKKIIKFKKNKKIDKEKLSKIAKKELNSIIEKTKKDNSKT